jgi:hypothetical protein
MRYTIEVSLLYVLLAWTLLVVAIHLALHRQHVRLVRAALPGGLACAVVRQPHTLWVFLDSVRPEAARIELGHLLGAWPSEQTGESVPGGAGRLLAELM